MVDKIKKTVLKIKDKELRKKIRDYFSLKYLIIYMWIGFFIFVLIYQRIIDIVVGGVAV